MGILKKLKQLTTLNKDIENADTSLVKLKSEINSIDLKLAKNKELLDNQELMIEKFSKEFQEENNEVRLKIIEEAVSESEKIKKESDEYAATVSSQFHETVKNNEELSIKN